MNFGLAQCFGYAHPLTDDDEKKTLLMKMRMMMPLSSVGATNQTIMEDIVL